MFNKKIIVPLIAVIVLLLALWAVTMIGDKNDADEITSSSEIVESSTAESLFDFDTKTISAVSVRTSEESFSLVKDGDKWYMPDNPNASISSTSVNMLCSSIGGVSYTESVTDGSISAGDCGIGDESDFVTFTSELGEVTLTRGITTTDGTLCYVMTNLSDTIYFAEADTVSKIFAPLTTYRNGASLKVNFDSLVSVTYSGKELIKLEKGSADTNNAVYNEWKMLTPVEMGANDDVINSKIIEPLKSIKIQSFASDSGNYADFGMGDRTKFVTLTDSDGKSQTVYFSAQTDGKYYISIDDGMTIYEIDVSDAPYITLDTISLADRNINLAKMTNISNVTIKGSDVDYTIEFMKDGGKINGTEVSSDVMNQSIFPSVCGLMADDIYTGVSGTSDITLTFNYTDSTQDVIEFASYNDRYYSVSKNGSVKYLILKTKLSELTKLLDNQI